MSVTDRDLSGKVNHPSKVYQFPYNRLSSPHNEH